MILFTLVVQFPFWSAFKHWTCGVPTSIVRNGVLTRSNVGMLVLIMESLLFAAEIAFIAQIELLNEFNAHALGGSVELIRRWSIFNWWTPGKVNVAFYVAWKRGRSISLSLIPPILHRILAWPNEVVLMLLEPINCASKVKFGFLWYFLSTVEVGHIILCGTWTIVLEVVNFSDFSFFFVVSFVDDLVEKSSNSLGLKTRKRLCFIFITVFFDNIITRAEVLLFIFLETIFLA